MNKFKYILSILCVQTGIHTVPWIYYFGKQYSIEDVSLYLARYRSEFQDEVGLLLIVSALLSYVGVVIWKTDWVLWKRFVLVTIFNLVLLVGHFFFYFSTELPTPFMIL